MKNKSKTVIFILIGAVIFLAGYGISFIERGKKQAVERQILYYVDPMNPAYRSDRPGISPACGMPLEPVYADGSGTTGQEKSLLASLPPGTIRITPEKQQMIGVKTVVIEKAPWNHSQRVLGRVVPDETLVHRVTAAIVGWIDEVGPVTTGALLKKNDLLATFYSLEYRSILQSYFNMVKAAEPSASLEGKGEAPSAKLNWQQLKQRRETAKNINLAAENKQTDYKKYLLNYGISEFQIEEMERTKTIPDVIEIRTPVSGFLLSRNVNPGFRFDRGQELFRIADLSRVWILADVFENEASYFKPGMQVKVELPYQKKTLWARVSPVLPQFDPATRTLKVRLMADNPGFALRPDMFVNVELSQSGPPAIVVPMDAVIDSGLKKMVFVDRGNGFFEPRQVETGHSLGERVEITQGLMVGEKIVVSGNFLLDSESRLQLASTGTTGKIGRDLVCGMNIDEDRAKKEGNLVENRGRAYFFCSLECRDEFRKKPEKYLKSPSTVGGEHLASSSQTEVKHPSPEPRPTPKKTEGKTGAPHKEIHKEIMATPKSSESGAAVKPKEAGPMMDQPLKGSPPPMMGTPNQSKTPGPMPGTQSESKTPGSMSSPPPLPSPSKGMGTFPMGPKPDPKSGGNLPVPGPPLPTKPGEKLPEGALSPSKTGGEIPMPGPPLPGKPGEKPPENALFPPKPGVKVNPPLPAGPPPGSKSGGGPLPTAGNP